MGSIPRPPIFRIPLTQLAVLLPLSGAAWFFNPTVSYSLILGGLIHLVPNAYFATQAFRYRGASSMRQAMGAIAKGEMLKFLLVVIGFALVFVYVEPFNVIALFGAYIGMTLVHTIATAKFLVG